MRLLVLGGSSEASALARALADQTNIDATLSLAGRTRSPVTPPISHRVGGFGGAQGLAAYLTLEKIDAVVDATHPFAARMSANAAEACRETGIPLAILTRPPWKPESGDNWTTVATMEGAARTLGEEPRRVFLTVGGLQLAAFAAAPRHHYLVRTIDPPEALSLLPDHRLILARGPFAVEDEIALMREERIDVLVSKNSGGGATEGKIAAARALNIPVIMVERPPSGDVPAFETVDAMLAWIATHRPAP